MSRQPISIPDQIDQKFDEPVVAIDEIVRRLVTDVEPVFRKHLMKDGSILDREAALDATDRWLAKGGGEGMLALRVGLSMLETGAPVDFSNFGEAVRQIVSQLDINRDGTISRAEIVEAHEAISANPVRVAETTRTSGRS